MTMVMVMVMYLIYTTHITVSWWLTMIIIIIVILGEIGCQHVKVLLAAVTSPFD